MGKNRDDLFEEFKLKKEIYWLFIEYFFTSSSVPLKKFIEYVEKNIILRTLSTANGNQAKAARILKTRNTTLNQKIKKYKIHIRK
jgi:transcriptional regulator with GAF, ATPase, and Fis domain